MKIKIALLAGFIVAIAAVIVLNETTSLLPSRAESKVEILDEEYIVTEEIVLNKLRSVQQIISMQQDFTQKFTQVDDGVFGERHTVFWVNGTYKMGLHINKVKVVSINKGTVHIDLPDPELISLEIPYDQIYTHKEKGILRTEMREDEKRDTYKHIEQDIRENLVEKDFMKQADLHNQKVIRELLTGLAGVKKVVFE